MSTSKSVSITLFVQALTLRVLKFRTGRWLLPLFWLVCTCGTALADGGKTILVLDASGSMWQKIADGYKIKIAQEVVGNLLDTIPSEQEIGLVTYGHRRKGDCADIELLVEPGPGTRQSIAEAVNGLDPKGKTPLSAAVIKAADELRIEENEATVILVSDGRETCNLDPCAVGTELEQRGINFTTHVIGFDVEQTEERAQLRCLAENTGGKFLTASNATELAEALVTVSVTTPVISTLTAVAEDEDGTRLREGLRWSLVDLQSESQVVEQQAGAQLSTELEPGRYSIAVLRVSDQQEVTLDVKVADSSRQFTLTLPALLPEASVTTVETVTIGEEFEVDWDGPAESGDRITIAKAGEAAGENIESRITANGTPVSLRAPTEAGEYEVRYVYAAKNRVLASQAIMVEESLASLEAPDSSPLATSIQVEWKGPDQNLDYIAVGKPGEKKHLNITRTGSGSPLKLQMPAEAGDYELRYVLYQDAKVLATRPITVTETQVSIEAADTATLAARIKVSWTGPDENLDYIGIAEMGSESVINLTRTSQGSPLLLEMPTSTGEFEIRYVSYHYKQVLATRPISVTDVVVSLDAPANATLGQTVEIGWQGPNENLDFIAVGIPGEPGSINITRTGRGNPLRLQMPSEAGEYELRYVLYQDRKILATRAISVESINVTLAAAESAGIGEEIEVSWEGPDENLDRITVAKPGDDSSINYASTSSGNPVVLTMPAEPDEYELRYVLYQGRTILASRPIMVNDVSASLAAQAESTIGESISVTWYGPDEKKDYIDVADMKTGRYINYTYTRDGSPLELQMPAKPGNYEIRYVLGQGKTVLASVPITVTAIEVELDAEDSATLGSSVAVTWIGPDEKRDYIAVADPEKGGYINYTYTRDGSPLRLQMPAKPGNYEIRYVLAQGKTVLGSVPITVNDVQVELEAADSAVIDSTVVVTWTGPNEKKDYIDIADPASGRYIKYTYTRGGSPLTLQTPSKPGDYEIRYVLGQDKTVLETRIITIVEE